MQNKMDTLEEQLQYLISTSLPGEKTHLAMSPLGRGVSSTARLKARDIRASAVVIVCYPADGTHHFLLTERSHYDGIHGGQISFPGGKQESTDLSLVHTAMRECMEEIGVELSEDQLVGRLTSVYIPVSNFDVAPYVFMLQAKPIFHINEREVATLFPVSFDALIDENNVSKMEVYVDSSATEFEVPCFSFGKFNVWGATAIVLNELKAILQLVDGNRV